MTPPLILRALPLAALVLLVLVGLATGPGSRPDDPALAVVLGAGGVMLSLVSGRAWGET
jgi:hypothetical protein